MTKKLLTPDFILSMTVLIGAFILLCLGIDGDVKAILGLAAGWAFRSGAAAAQQKQQ